MFKKGLKGFVVVGVLCQIFPSFGVKYDTSRLLSEQEFKEALTMPWVYRQSERSNWKTQEQKDQAYRQQEGLLASELSRLASAQGTINEAQRLTEMGEAHVKFGSKKEALDFFKKAEVLGDPHAAVNIGRLFSSAHGFGQRDEYAAPFFQKAIDNPNYTMGDAYYHMGKLNHVSPDYSTGDRFLYMNQYYQGNESYKVNNYQAITGAQYQLKLVETAVQFYQEGARRGSVEAQAALDTLKRIGTKVIDPQNPNTTTWGKIQ